MEDKKVNDLLEKLALKFNTTAEKLYIVMIKQVKVDAIKSGIGLVMFAFSGFAVKYLWSLLNPLCVPGLQGDGSWPTEVRVMWAVLLLGTLGWFAQFLIFISKSLGDIINAWINPEGVAFNRILRYFN